MPPKRSTRQNSVANSHAEVESQGHSHAMGETHAQGGGQIHTQGGGQTHGGENPFGGGQAHDGGQVLGGEIPVGGPQQMALMFEMIKGMQQNQAELAESLRQMREANGNKEDHQNKNDNRNHEERESHNKNDTPFVTMSDVADLLKRERERPPKEPRHFVRRPPYPIELLKEPYPEKYDTPVFALFDGRKGSAMEHISKFLDSMGPFAAHGDLCLREFSKSLVDRAYTWYTVLPAGSIRTWEDMVESFCSKYFHVEEKITLVNLHGTKQQIGEDLVKYIHRFRDVSLDCHVKYQEGELVEVCIDNMLPEFRAHLENLDITRFAPLLQKARKTAISVKPQVEKSRDKKSLPQTLTVSTTTAPSGTKRKSPSDKAYEEPPPLPFTAEEMMAIFDKYVNHPTVDCRTLRWEVNRKIQDGTLQLSEAQQKVHQTPFPNYNKDKGKAVVSVVIHGNVSDMEAEESAAASSSLVPAAVRTLQKSPKFKSLFNQLGFGPEARNAATEALITIAAESGATCFTAEAHASRAFLETTNAITFTDEDMEVQYPDHRRPLYLSAVVKDVQVRRALVDTGSCLNLIPLSTLQAANVPQQKIQGSPMEVGPIVALTRFHVVNAETPYHVLLGRPWLHKHKLVSSTYHQCVKGRLNGKPIRIAANSCPFDQTEAHFVEAALYDDLASTGEPSIVRPCGTPLPAWEDIKDDPEIDLRELLERKKKRKEREVEHGSPPQCQEGPTPEEGGLQPSCHLTQQTENSGKVAVDQIQSTAMNSEKVTVDHAQSTSPWTVDSERPVVDQEESTAMDPGGSTVDHASSTVRNSGAEAVADQTESTTMSKEKSTTAEPNITSKEELEVINLSDDPDITKPISISKSLSAKERKCLIDLLHEYKDVFAWDYHEMPGIDPGLVAHSLNVEPDYVDDIVVKSKKREDHLRVLRKVFDRCRLYKLKMNPLKCAFGVSAGKFLGFLVHNRGIDVDPAKASAIATMKAPTSHKELKSFLGRLSYIRRFIPGLAAATAIFMPLMKKGVPFVCPWQTTAFYTWLPIVKQLGAWWPQEDEEGTEKANLLSIKSQAIADLLAQFPGEDSSSISHEVPGEIGEALLADLADSTWTLKFDGSSTSSSSGAGIVLTREDGETIAKSFKLDFSCSNNASEYEAYITGLVIAHEMGIKHLRVIGDSNLIICQTKVSFEGSKVDITIDKRSMPITDLLKEKFKEQNLDAEDWRTPIRAKLMSPEGVADLKVLKDYVLIAGDLYRRLPGGVLARCVSLQEAAKKLTEVHERNSAHSCQHQHESDQVYATFVSSDWRTPFLEYLIENVLPQTSQAATRLKKLATRYFVEGGILFRKGFHGDPLRCLSLAESQTVMKEAHSGECGEHQGKKRLYQLLLTLGYYWPTMKKDTADFVKSCHTCQLQANLIHTHPTSLQNMATPWPFHTWGLDLIGPINPSSGGCIWILVATEYFTKWVEAIPLRKATGAAVANFIREHIITRFGIPHKIISDNGTPFVNKNVKEVLEHYRIKHRRSTPYYPQGNGQAEATNRMLLRILSKMVFDYGKGWNSHLADTLWAYRGSTKTATGFTPFSLVYGTDAISPTELLVPSPRILHGMDLEADADICAEARVADLEGLEEARELAQARSLRYHQKLADAYEKTLQTRIFAKGQMVLRAVDHVRRGLPSPSKFAPNWEGPYLIREAYDSGYYKLSTADGTTLVDPINGKWLKRYYS
uniref:Integrase catalytic domain-containing protein n=1 Tax=Fagus sylvatica TaxID=28930 RepID=A0A2N9GXX6_FAGSY